jgi:hypothetical protein
MFQVMVAKVPQQIACPVISDHIYATKVVTSISGILSYAAGRILGLKHAYIDILGYGL